MDEELYVLVRWPFSQSFMEFPWFRSECYLLTALEEQEHIDSAYFIPKERIDSLTGEEMEKMPWLVGSILKKPWSQRDGT